MCLFAIYSCLSLWQGSITSPQKAWKRIGMRRQPYCFHLSVCIGNWPITRLFLVPSGQHHTESAWQHRLSRPHSFVYVILSLSSHWASLLWVLALTLWHNISGSATSFWHARPFVYTLLQYFFPFCLISLSTCLVVYSVHDHHSLLMSFN